MVGQQFLMGRRFLDGSALLYNSLFNRQLTGKKQAFEKFIHWIFELFCYCAPVLEISAEISANSLCGETGKEQGKVYKEQVKNR